MKYAIVATHNDGRKELFVKETKWTHDQVTAWVERKYKDLKSVEVKSLEREGIRTCILRNNFIVLIGFYGNLFRYETPVVIRRGNEDVYVGVPADLNRDMGKREELMDAELKAISQRTIKGRLVTVWEIAAPTYFRSELEF